jgi:hypothetical protein
MASGDLDISLLYKIMIRAGEFRGRKSEYAKLNELLDLLPPCKNAEEKINTERVFSRVRAGNAHEAPFFRPLNNQPPSTLRHLPLAP